MILNKPFKDIGSIVKALMRYVDLQRFYITIGFDPNYPGMTTIKVLPHNPMSVNTTMVYGWYPGSTQVLNIPDSMCVINSHLKKAYVESPFRRNYNSFTNGEKK